MAHVFRSSISFRVTLGLQLINSAFNHRLGFIPDRLPRLPRRLLREQILHHAAAVLVRTLDKLKDNEFRRDILKRTYPDPAAPARDANKKYLIAPPALHHL